MSPFLLGFTFPSESRVCKPSLASNFIEPNLVFPVLNSIVSPPVIIWAKDPVEVAEPLIWPEAVIWPSPISTKEPWVYILPYTSNLLVFPEVPTETSPEAEILPEAVICVEVNEVTDMSAASASESIPPSFTDIVLAYCPSQQKYQTIYVLIIQH